MTERPTAESSIDDDDSVQDAVAQVFAEIDAGRLTLDEAIAQNPVIESRLREIASLQRLLKTAQPAPIPDAPKNLGEYKIVGVVGRGGMGIVYRAYHERLRREVAVKTIRPTHVSTHARERFQREQTALARLHQTHIVPIYAAGSDAAIEYFVMPYIEGASLHRVLEILRRGESGGRSKSDTLFSLVQSTTEGRGGRSTSSFVSLNGEPSTHRRSNGFGVPATVETPAEPPRSLAYCHSAATIIASAAEALEHAHRRQVFHRDLKPNNIMLAADGRLWIIDFGLASFLPHENYAEGAGQDSDAELLTNVAVGTWSYMAPEQFERKTDARTDVWGLGVTLYEMLTLRRAFAHRSSSEWKQAAAAEHPPHPATAAPALPADLAAICWKAMAKDPVDRYQSAGEFAEDLRRWLRDDPVRARKRGLSESTRRWVAKHRAWAAVIALLTVAIPTMIALQWQASVKDQAVIAEQRRQLIVRDLETLLHSEKEAGWSAKALKEIVEAAAIRKDAMLRDAAVVAFTGLDAKLIDRNLKFGASSVAFDATGKRVVLGGVRKRGGRPATPAHVWNLNDPSPTAGKVEGPGLVAFRRDGAPVQLVSEPFGRLKLLHVLTGEILREYSLPKPNAADRFPTMAISANADQVAASFPHGLETFVWSDAVAPIKIPVAASAIAFSKDGSLVAIGSPSGETSIWSTAEGKRLGAFSLATLSVQALSFSPRAVVQGEHLGGEIAVGWFGRCAVVDLSSGMPTCVFGTGAHAPKNLEFAPDAAMLVADNILFDAASGGKLLQLQPGMEASTFSPDGLEMCHASGEGFSDAEVVRLSLRKNRGIEMLQGLPTPAARLAFSAKGRRLAALSSDWRLAVWNFETGQLIRTIRAPEGPLADNAAIAFNEDGSEIAAVTGKEARLWNADTGACLKEWTLPPGISNDLSFTNDGKLLLVRNELKSMKDYPWSSYRFPEHPRRIRGRNLFAADSTAPLYEIDAFPKHSFGVAMTPDGGRILADGLDSEGKRSVQLLDGKTGKSIRTYPLTHDRDYRSVKPDPTGTVLMFFEQLSPERCRAISAVDGAFLEVSQPRLSVLGPRAELWLGRGQESDSQSLGIFRRGDATPRFRLLHAGRWEVSLFSKDGRFLAFETSAGAVGILDIPKIERLLDELGLR
jgi:eukaryotic-like serine/threonine-protein kinase